MSTRDTPKSPVPFGKVERFKTSYRHVYCTCNSVLKSSNLMLFINHVLVALKTYSRCENQYASIVSAAGDKWLGETIVCLCGGLTF